MKKWKMRKGLCIALAAVMVLAVGGCGGSAGQKATGTAAEQTVRDTADVSSAGQETSDTSALSSKSENALESSAVSSEKQENPELSDLPSAGEMPFTFTFSSGAGGWSTDISLWTDGTFVGGYHDSDMGTSDDDYPNGTMYYCNFSGRLEIVQKLDAYSYALKLASLEKEKGNEFIEDGIRYVPSEPYGMEKGKNYILYLPDTPLDGLSEEFLMWWPGRYDMQEQQRTTLGYYGLYNQDMEYGFFGEVTGE